MASTKISEMTEIEELNGEEYVPLVQNGANVKYKISNLNKPIRKMLFDDSDNTSLEITLSDSVYNYSYLYVESSASTYNAMIPIFSDSQTSFRGIGGFSGEDNVGSTHTQGSISNNGETITFGYFTSIVHNSADNHASSVDRSICKIYGIR